MCSPCSAPIPLPYRRHAFPWLEASASSSHISMHVMCWAANNTMPLVNDAAPSCPCFLVVADRPATHTKEAVAGPPSCRVVVMLLSGNSSSAPSPRGVHLSLVLVQQLLGLAKPPLLRVVTCGVLSSDAAHGGVWGFARVLRLESPALGTQSIDVPRSAATLPPFQAPSAEGEVAWRGDMRTAARLRECSAPLILSGALARGAYAVTGGLGGLGMRAATMLVMGGASHVLLASRSGFVVRGGQGLDAQLLSIRPSAAVVACDSADTREATSLFGTTPLAGVLHGSGVGDKGLLVELIPRRVQWMYAPKAFAGWHLHNLAANVPLDAFCLFSSVGSGIGNVGQANYAAGNACLDAQALSRRARGIAACSLQWPLVATAGMGAAAFAGIGERQVAFAGLAGISLEEYAACLGAQLTLFCGTALSVQMAHCSDVHELLQDLADASEPRFGELIAEVRHAHGFASGPVAAPTMGGALAHSLLQLAPAQRRDHVEAAVVRIVRELTTAPVDTLTAETPLMEAGVDSLSATELSSRLRALTGVPLSPTIVFEQPTPRAVAEHLLEQAVGGVAVGRLPAHMATAHVGASLAVTSVLGQWPGGCSGKAAREQLQCASGDALSSVPASRWVLALVVDVAALTDTQVSCVRHGGFVSGAQCFDAHSFGTSSAEAGAMDPQQRLLLEHGYAALHHASQRRAVLMGGNVAVFLGIERPDWALAQPPEARGSVYAVTGDNVSVAAGRVSFVLGLHGPCSSVDTACASALVALHGGAHAARSGECLDALSLAVSLKLVPHGTLGAASGGDALRRWEVQDARCARQRVRAVRRCWSACAATRW